MIEDSIEIKDIIDNIARDKRTHRPLPGNGFLFFEHDLPFLIVYNRVEEDYTTLSLVKSKSSYLIISESHKEFYQELCNEIAKAMSGRFGSFLILEIYTGPLKSKQFVVSGNKKKFPATLKVLKKELTKIERRRGEVQVSASTRSIIENDKETGVLNIEGLEKSGAQFLRLEVPPVYKSEQGDIYPTYFTGFRKSFVKSVQKALFEFARVQTSSKIESYTALGKRKLDEVIFKIDKQLHEIQAGYQFLLLIAPTNLHEARQHFFDSNFEEVPDYHYRMLPINPDLLKRRLFNLRIEDINDPAFTYIFDEKREEIDQELTMLKERGSRNFLYRSVRRYRGLKKSLVQEAETILKEIPHEEIKEETQITAKEFALMAEDEFNYFKKQSANFKSKIHIRDDVNILMVSQGELYLPSDTKMSEKDARALIQHEIGTHVLTYYNGKQQPLYQLSAGLSDYDPIQEGIAMLSECLIGAMSANRLRTIAGRVVAGAALLDGMNFKQMFHALYGYYGFSKEKAFSITSRMFQGGGFLKDIIYLKGLIKLRQYLMDGGDLNCLLAGKFAIKHIEVINELTERGILMPPAIKPRYMDLPDYESKINKIRKGIPIYKLQEL